MVEGTACLLVTVVVWLSGKVGRNIFAGRFQSVNLWLLWPVFSFIPLPSSMFWFLETGVSNIFDWLGSFEVNMLVVACKRTLKTSVLLGTGHYVKDQSEWSAVLWSLSSLLLTIVHSKFWGLLNPFCTLICTQRVEKSDSNSEHMIFWRWCLSQGWLKGLRELYGKA